MSHRRGYGNGIIRPRPLNTNYRKTDKSVSMPTLSKRTLFALVIAFGLAFMFMAASTLFKARGSGSGRGQLEGSGPSVRGRASEVEEEVDDYSSGDSKGDEDAESEENEAGGDGEDAEDDETDSDAGEDKDGEEDESDGNDIGAAEDDEEEESTNEDSANAVETTSARKSDNKLKLNLHRYFNNAGKKHVMMESSGSFKYIMAKITDYEGTSAFGYPGLSFFPWQDWKKNVSISKLRSILKTALPLTRSG